MLYPKTISEAIDRRSRRTYCFDTEKKKDMNIADLGGAVLRV